MGGEGARTAARARLSHPPHLPRHHAGLHERRLCRPHAVRRLLLLARDADARDAAADAGLLLRHENGASSERAPHGYTATPREHALAAVALVGGDVLAVEERHLRAGKEGAEEAEGRSRRSRHVASRSAAPPPPSPPRPTCGSLKMASWR